MSPASRIAGDEVNVAVLVEVEPAHAFRVFTEEIDQWWRRGPQVSSHVESGERAPLWSRVSGRLFESF